MFENLKVREMDKNDYCGLEQFKFNSNIVTDVLLDDNTKVIVSMENSEDNKNENEINNVVNNDNENSKDKEDKCLEGKDIKTDSNNDLGESDTKFKKESTSNEEKNNESEAENAKKVEEVKKELPKIKTVILPQIKEAENFFNSTIRDQAIPIHKFITSLYKSFLFAEQKTNILAISKETVHLVGAIKSFAEKNKIPVWVDNTAANIKLNYDKSVITQIAINYVNNNAKYLGFDKNGSLGLPAGIVVLTNIDSYPNGVYQEHLVHEYFCSDLADFIKGMKVPLVGTNKMPIVVDTSKVTFVLIGEFKGIKKVQYQDITNCKMGFKCTTKKDLDYSNITKEQLVQYGDGVGDKLIENITDIVCMQKVTKESMKSFLTQSISSPLYKYCKLLAELGVTLRFMPNVINEIVEEAYTRDEDYRDLDIIVSNMFTEILYNVYNILAQTAKIPFEVCVLLDGITKDNNKFTFANIQKENKQPEKEKVETNSDEKKDEDNN